MTNEMMTMTIMIITMMMLLASNAPVHQVLLLLSHSLSFSYGCAAPSWILSQNRYNYQCEHRHVMPLSIAWHLNWIPSNNIILSKGVCVLCDHTEILKLFDLRVARRSIEMVLYGEEMPHHFPWPSKIGSCYMDRTFLLRTPPPQVVVDVGMELSFDEWGIHGYVLSLSLYIYIYIKKEKNTIQLNWTELNQLNSPHLFVSLISFTLIQSSLVDQTHYSLRIISCMTGYRYRYRYGYGCS